MTASNVIAVEWLGRIGYARAWQHQQQLVAQAEADATRPDHLLLLEHPPTYTIGRRGSLDNLLLDEAQRAQAGIALHHVDRGGDITYHGPGQLVGYPIMRVGRQQGRDFPDLHRYLRDLEQVLIDALAGFEIAARRFPGYTGVWVDDRASGEPRKIAAIGVKVSGGGISSHGFALNVDPDLTHFAGIVPCGIREHGVTSLAQQLGRPLPLLAVLPHVVRAFAAVFDCTPSLHMLPAH